MRGSLIRELSTLITAIAAFVAVFTAAAEPARGDVTYRTLDYKEPGGPQFNTYLTGIRGPYITAFYSYPTAPTTFYGLIYNQSTSMWSHLDFPGTPSGPGGRPPTAPYGPDPVTGGLHVVGSYNNGTNAVGFYYDSTKPSGQQFVTLQPLNLVPNPPFQLYDTIAHSIYGNQVVGNYDALPDLLGHAFLSDVGGNTPTYKNRDELRASTTTAYGIWENYVAGGYVDLTLGIGHAYRRDLSTYPDPSGLTTFDYPASGVIDTHFEGITGNGTGGFNYVGDYTLIDGTVHGFFYDGTNLIPLAYPGAVTTSANSVYGQTVVGVYKDAHGVFHGYVANVVIPEPSSLALACTGGLMGLFALIRRRKHKVLA